MPLGLSAHCLGGRAGCALGLGRSASKALGLSHGFPTPVRLQRGEAIYPLRVFAGPRGRCRVENGGAQLDLQVLAAEGGAFDLIEGERRRRVVLNRAGRAIWMRDGARNWDFDDISFEPIVKAEATRDGKVRAAMNGRVASLAVALGARVARGQTLLVLEAMKMEHVHVANVEGEVTAIHVGEGDQVEAHRVLIEVAPS